MTEQELVRAAQKGDQAAFGQLVEANQDMVYALADRMTGTPDDAEDLTGPFPGTARLLPLAQPPHPQRLRGLPPQKHAAGGALHDLRRR